MVDVHIGVVRENDHVCSPLIMTSIGPSICCLRLQSSSNQERLTIGEYHSLQPMRVPAPVTGKLGIFVSHDTGVAEPSCKWVDCNENQLHRFSSAGWAVTQASSALTHGGILPARKKRRLSIEMHIGSVPCNKQTSRVIEAAQLRYTSVTC